MATTVTLRMDDKTYRDFVRRARLENRSLANFVETAVREHIAQTEFADRDEMAGILADDALVERLKRGSLEARRRKGRRVG